MTALPRILVLIGSGELAPRMTRGHRMLVGRIVGKGGRPAQVTAAILDTPYRFQENAASLSAELLDYFGRRIGMSASIAALGRADEPVLVREKAFATIRDADFVFSGPGSPSYAVRHWSGSAVPQLIAQKLLSGGVCVFASAAALTMGRRTLPVYEIYKGGADPYWLAGLDVLSSIGIRAAVVPHFDNGEGEGHDTRFCFLGERRLELLEERLDDGTYILGVDEHTALMVDLDAERAVVHGRGGMTIREHGRSTIFQTGSDFPLDELRRSGAAPAPVQPSAPAVDAGTDAPEVGLARRLIEVERDLATRIARAELVEPLLREVIALRASARAAGDYEMADAIRERLAKLGVELTDSQDGTTDFRLPGLARATRHRPGATRS